MDGNKLVTLDLIELVAHALGELNEKSVFVGGATVPFYLSTEMQAAARATDDVDIVLEMINLGHREKYEELLRKKGFQHDISQGAPLCRWKFKGLTVDIMSPHEKIFGFSNRWYLDGIKNSISVNAGKIKIRILALPYFLATKIEAFNDRGKNDFMSSSDMEDIVTVLDGSPQKLLENQIGNLTEPARDFLKSSFSNLLINQDFKNALPGAVFDRANARARSAAILERLNQLSKILGNQNA